MKAKLILIILCTISTVTARAEMLSFDNFLQNALNNSYEIKLAKLNKQSTEYGIKESRSGYFPTLAGYAITERYNNLGDSTKPMTAVGNEIILNNDYYQEMGSLIASYNLFDFGARKKTLDIAKADDKQKQILLFKSQRDLKLDAVDIYAETLNLFKKQQISNKILSLQNELIEINERLKEAGELSEIELTDTKIETSETKTELDEIKNSLSKRLTEISYYTGKNYQLNETEIADFPKYDAEPEKTENGAIKLSAEVITLRPENSLEAKSYDLEIEKKQKEYEIQKKVNFPKIRFDTRYNLYGSDSSSFFDSFQDISQRSFALRLSASFTLFDGFKNVNAVHKKRLEIEKTKAEKEKELAELKKKFDQIQLDAQNAIIQEKNNQITLNLVNKNLEMTERLNVNGLIEKSKVLRKRIELLEKKQKLEETGIRNYAAKFKLQVLTENMGDL